MTHLLKVSEVSTGPCPCSTRLLMPCSALRGLYMDKYLSICEWRKRDDSQPVSYVWRPGIKQTGTCSVTPGNPDNDINTYTYTFFLHPSAPPHPPHCISHSLTHTHTHMQPCQLTSVRDITL